MVAPEPPAPTRIKPTVIGPQKPVHYPQPVPSASACADADKLVHDLYKDEFAKTTPQERAVLGLKLWSEAATDANEPMTTYVLLRDAADALQTGGDVLHAVEAVQKMGRLFAIDWQAREAEALAVTAPKVTVPTIAHAGTQLALNLSEQAMQSGRYDISAKAAAAALSLARKTREPGLLTWTSNWAIQTQAAQDQSKQVAASLEKIKTSVNDAAATAAAGRFLCLWCGQWSRGLPLLAKSNDTLKALATKELKASPDDAAAQLAVADGWADAAAKESGAAKDAIAAHAACRYQQAMSGLSGLQRTTAAKRLRELCMAHLDHGLVAEYYRGRSFQQKISTRIDSTIEWDWTNIPPEQGLSSYYSVRWTGWLKPNVAVNYKILSRFDDGTRVWIDNKLVIDHWDDHHFGGSVTLPLGADPVELKVEYNQISGPAIAGLGWVAPGSKKPCAIPAGAFFHGPVNMEHIVPPAPAVDQDGAITLSALQTTIHGSRLGFLDDPRPALGWWQDPKDWVSWDFTAPAGDYDVDIQFCVQGNAGGQYIVNIGGAEVSGTASDTGGWGSSKTETLGRIRIGGGNQVATIKCQSITSNALMNFEAIILRPAKPDQ